MRSVDIFHPLKTCEEQFTPVLHVWTITVLQYSKITRAIWRIDIQGVHAVKVKQTNNYEINFQLTRYVRNRLLNVHWTVSRFLHRTARAYRVWLFCFLLPYLLHIILCIDGKNNRTLWVIFRLISENSRRALSTKLINRFTKKGIKYRVGINIKKAERIGTFRKWPSVASRRQPHRLYTCKRIHN